LQAGEGGMITTNDDALAKELTDLRNFGDMSSDFRNQDQKQLTWNGKASEIVTAVAYEQFKKYPGLISRVHENVQWFVEQIKNMDEIKLKPMNNGQNKSTYTQIVIELNESARIRKSDFFSAMISERALINHANFEPLTALGFFKNKTWKDWIVKGDLDSLDAKYSMPFPIAEQVFERTGFGINRSHFETKTDTENILTTLKKCVRVAQN
jgi:dTDP-4-amino-4,6-dideoxygalactose transaminase